MSRKLAFDRVLFGAVALLVLLGLTAVLSASAVVSLEDFGWPYHFFVRQVMWLGVGSVGLVFAMRTDYRTWNRRPIVALAALGALALLIAVLLAPPINGTHRWLRLGPASLQVAEVARLALIVYLAHHLDRRRDEIARQPSTLLPPLLIALLMLGLVYLQPDLGSALILGTLVVGLLFVGGLKLRILLPAVAVGGVALIGAVVLSGGYQLERIRSYVDHGSDPLGADFQVQQAKLAIGSGGWIGRGLGAGRQKLLFLPEPHTDFIFAVTGEELGLIGTGLVLAAFTVYGARGLRAAVRAPDRFGSLLAAGMSGAVLLPAAVHLGVSVGAVPPTGMTLPFMSYGGSSLVCSLFATGVVLNISQHG